MLKNKKILITGIANKYSIALGIAQAMVREGAEIAIAYQNERLLKNIEPIAQELGTDVLIECDVSSDDSINASRDLIIEKWGTFDGFVHSIGFAPSDQLVGNFVDVTTREGFQIAHDVSSYSFTALSKAYKDILNENSALLTLTYLGSIQTMPNYNVMGLAKASLEANTRFLAASLGKDKIRVNAILPGLVAGDRQNNVLRNKAQRLGKSFSEVEEEAFSFTSIKEYVDAQDIANQVMYLASDAGMHVSGQAIAIDCDTKMLL